jgi:hypothetical protein
MVVNVRLIKEIRKLTTDELIKSGMQLKKRIFIYEMTKDVWGTLGLNEATGGFLEINPVIGVSNQTVEKLVLELREKEATQIIATVSTHLGYLMPIYKSYRPWNFYEGKDYESKVKRMVATINKYGKRFMEANVDIKTLLTSMRKHGSHQNNAYRIPVVYYLMGKPILAKEYILNELTKLGDTHPWDIEYKEYAKKFLERL